MTDICIDKGVFIATSIISILICFGTIVCTYKCGKCCNKKIYIED